MHLGSDDTGKRWPGNSAKNILSLAVGRGYHCFLFDTMGTIEGRYQDGVTLIVDPGIGRVMAVILACDILLCVDSFTFKIGEYFKKKVIPLFGFVPDYAIANKSMYQKSIVLSPEDIFFAIDNWVETPVRSGGTIFDDIKTFEI
jgi:ADP-heptose:LPS heptosyltransferase